MKFRTIQFKRFNSILFVLLFFCCDGLSAGKIGFVDMEKLINNSPQIRNARESINIEFEAQYTDIEQKESDLKILEDYITKDGAMMTLDELSPLQERARKLDRQIRRLKEDLKDAIIIRNNQTLNNIQNELGAMVKQYAIENNYDAILINSILYVSEDMNITNKILQLLKDKNSKNED
jgi:outer membrane protein